MNRLRTRLDAGTGRPASHADFIVAYCEGLGLAAIVLVSAPAGGRLAAVLPDAAMRMQPAEAVCWWCRRMDDAERIAAAAARAMARRAPNGQASCTPTAAQYAAAVAAAAKRRNVALYADADILADAEAVIARVHAEFERFRGTGELKAINQSYRHLRLEALERGEKLPPYAQWLNKYRLNLVRQLAAALR